MIVTKSIIKLYNTVLLYYIIILSTLTQLALTISIYSSACDSFTSRIYIHNNSVYCTPCYYN